MPIAQTVLQHKKKVVCAIKKFHSTQFCSTQLICHLKSMLCQENIFYSTYLIARHPDDKNPDLDAKKWLRSGQRISDFGAFQISDNQISDIQISDTHCTGLVIQYRKPLHIQPTSEIRTSSDFGQITSVPFPDIQKRPKSELSQTVLVIFKRSSCLT